MKPSMIPRALEATDTAAQLARFREALEWALSEIAGEAVYTLPGQRDACLARAIALLSIPSPTPTDRRSE